MVVAASSIRIVLRSAIIFQIWVMNIFFITKFQAKKKGKNNNHNSSKTEEINACLLNKPEKYEKLNETAWLDLDLIWK